VFVKRWLHQRQFAADSRRLQTQGRWGDNEDTLEFFTDHLARVSFPKIPLEVMETLAVTTFEPNVDRLIHKLEQATHYIDTRATFPVDKSEIQLRIYSLEQFLSTVHQRPLSPSEVTSKLLVDVREFIHALRLLHSQEDPTEGYYRRRTQMYVADLRQVLAQLCQLAGLRLSSPT
jgi:hypothetical protein